MTDASTFGGGTAMDAAQDQGGGFGSSFGGAGTAPVALGNNGADVPPAPVQPAPSAPGQTPMQSFGAGLNRAIGGPQYTPPDPQTSALDQSAATLQQRIDRANQIATNPMLQIFQPEGVQRARDFVPKAAEELQKIKTQKAAIAAGKTQGDTLGLSPGEVPDEATQADRVEVAKSRALKGDLRVFKGLQAVDPLAAGAIQDQVHEAVASHLGNAQKAFDLLSSMPNQGKYDAAVRSLREDGTLTDLETLGMKLPKSFDEFNSSKSKEGQALREARIGVDSVRQKLEERNTYQPMEEKEAKTYNGRLTTAYGDQITNGTWGRNGSSNVRGLIVNGAADPRDLGKSFTLATPEQRKEIIENADKALPKEDREKFRAFTRTYDLATKDSKGNAIPAEGAKDSKGNVSFLNTNPNVQQGVAEGLASMLRGGSGGANVGLLKIELAKRGWAQGAIDGLVSNYAGAVNTLFADANRTDKPYLSQATQKQIRDVMDVLKTYNDGAVSDRIGSLAERAGALGLDRSAFGFGKDETAGGVDAALERGRQAQIARMLPNHQAIGGGDGVFQLGAQRPGAGATALNPGTTPATQLPGAQPLATPVQQATQPQPSAPPSVPGGGAGSPPPAPPAVAAPPQGGPGPAGGGAPPAGPQAPPVTIAGQPVSVPLPPGVSPNFVPALARIETGKSKDPWTATTPGSSASGAYQFIDKTWNDNKPAGVTAMRAKDATPAEQTAAFANLVAKNAQTLTANGLPVNDTSLYVAHNLGASGASTLLKADPNADARTVVGEKAAANNPLFFRGKPTVATVLARYDAEMKKEPPQLPAGGGAAPQSGGAPSLMTRISRMLSQGIPGSGADKDAAVREVGDAAVEHAPAIGGTLGAIGGTAAGGPVGGVAGGAAGGGAGQAFKDYLQGRPFSAGKTAEEAALSGVLSVGSAARPVLSAVARAGGAGVVEGAAEAARGGDAEDIAGAAAKGTGLAAGGELFGRSLGMIGHKVWNMFAPDAKAAVREAARSYSEAEATLASESPKLPGVGTAAGGPNPKYDAAQAAKDKAEVTLKDAGLKPEEAAYAHKVSSDELPPGVQEAQVARPGAVEKDRIGAGYDQLRDEVGATGVGAVKSAPKLPDGPRAAVENKKVSADHAELADHVEMAITAPAKNWQDKWTQLQKARSDLLQAERDAQSSTAPGRTKTAADMRTLADTVRAQQVKAAKYVFGEKDGEAFIGRLKVLDTRYHNLMDATNGGDLAKAAALKGDAGRDAEKKFVAFAHDDPQAIAAYRAMRKGGSNVENDVRTLVGMEKIPYIGSVVTWAKMAGRMREWAQERAAGNPVSFADLVKTPGFFESNKPVRDLLGSVGARAATQ